MCSGIICGRVLEGELYAQRIQKLIYLHLFTDCFNEDTDLHLFQRLRRHLHETLSE